ncbi:hypothetical protein K439DRAFT_1535859 [Ramaria rubella]|nr:hypothetical protein K439DRAFT_1535859 [Ramaria rubella]
MDSREGEDGMVGYQTLQDNTHTYLHLVKHKQPALQQVHDGMQSFVSLNTSLGRSGNDYPPCRNTQDMDIVKWSWNEQGLTITLAMPPKVRILEDFSTQAHYSSMSIHLSNIVNAIATPWTIDLCSMLIQATDSLELGIIPSSVDFAKTTQASKSFECLTFVMQSYIGSPLKIRKCIAG